LLILAIDTASKTGSAALYESGRGLLGELTVRPGTNHSAVATKLIETLFELTERKIGEIDRVAVTVGPGSYTGIRIGLALAKGLCYACGKDIVGVSTLDVLAAQIARRGEEIVPMLDARGGRVYAARYAYGAAEFPERTGEIENIDIDALLDALDPSKETLFTGEGALVNAERIRARFDEKALVAPEILTIPGAGTIARIAMSRTPDKLFSLEARYAGKSQAERNKERREIQNG
jgi:N6-L-threonylcarbamoyladenine synthase